MARSAIRLALVCGLVAMGAAACTKPASRAVAEVVKDRSQLLGGPDALGDLGDLKLSNGKVRFIIQGITDQSNYSRGWGVYGGSVVDADLVRGDAPSTPPRGRDRFGELFPAYFLDAIAPETVQVGNDGADGSPASVIVRGRARPFLTTAANLIDATLAPDDQMTVTTTYSLGPDDQYLTITSELVDIKDRKFPASQLGSIDLAIPFGTVLLFGNQNEVFVPKTGFDIRYGLQDAYAEPSRLPVLPGLVSDLIATRGQDVSYGVAIDTPTQPDWSYAFRNRAKLGPETRATDMVMPFYASSFTGVFSAQPPDLLEAGQVFRWRTFFIVGNGDVGSVRDIQLKLHRRTTGRFLAHVREAGTGVVVPGASVIVLDDQGRPYAEYTPDGEGRISGSLPPGRYDAVVTCDHRERSTRVPFFIEADKTVELASKSESQTSRTLEVPRNAILNVLVTERGEGAGRPMPAKITLVGTSAWKAENRGLPPRKFLYDLKLGERMRPTDGIADTAEPGTRRYVERVLLAGADGRASGEVKPGTYEIVVSRGPEYEAVSAGSVIFEAGQVYDKAVQVARVVPTAGWVSADFHVHSANSIDSRIPLDQRVRTYAAEGVEYLASTDHNVVTDLAPNVQALGLEDFLKTTIGLEMTTLEMGHFNAFPLAYDPVSATHGAFPWVDLPPRDLFQKLRCAGTNPAQTIVQVNHPRDTILGYFNQFNVSQDTGLPRPGNPIASPNGPAFRIDQFSWKYDAIEVFNGKRHEQLHTYRMPAELPAPPYPELPIRAGEVVREPCPKSQPNCDYSKQEIAYPGVVEDWFKLLNMGGKAVNLGTGDETRELVQPVTATGNSDSHGVYFEEAGYPRNFLNVGKDDPKLVTETDVTRAIRRHKVVFSNGPFIEVVADGGQARTSPIGGLLAPVSGDVKLGIRVSAAPWVDVDRVRVYVNGEVVKTLPVDTRDGSVRCCNAAVEVQVPGDGWIVVEAEGDGSLFPVVTPQEEAPLAISDALSSISGPLGLAGSDLGNLAPAEVHPATPFAMTNPIWIDREGGANNAGDGVSFGRGRDVEPAAPDCGATGSQSSGLSIAGAPAGSGSATLHQPRQRQPSDLAKLFKAWGHGHAP